MEAPVKISFGVAAMALVAVIGCGRSEQQAETEKAAENIQKGAETMQQAAEKMGEAGKQNADQMAQGLAQMAQGFQQMAQGSAKAVDFELLVAELPTLDGWTRSEPRGEQRDAPLATSRAEAVYRKDDSRIEVEIVDTALNQLVLAPISMFTAMGFSERSSDGFKRSTKIGTYPAFEEWNIRSKRGEVTAIVGNRYIVTAKGDDVADLDPVKKAVEAVNLSKLAAIK
jgi:X-X-X-Leu-X-X-Gly heptad repeat protein